MRINLKFETSLSTYESRSKDPSWLTQVLTDFAISYDLNVDDKNEKVIAWLYKPHTVKLLIEWMKGEGYKCNYYELLINPNEPDKHDNNSNDFDDDKFSINYPFNKLIAYGIEIDENSEKFVELKLRAQK